MGAFPKVSRKHLDRYLEEREWRFNNRENPYQPVAKVVTAFDRPCIPADCVALRSHMSNMLPQSALSGGRRNGLGARGTFATGCYTFRDAMRRIVRAETLTYRELIAGKEKGTQAA